MTVTDEQVEDALADWFGRRDWWAFFAVGMEEPVKDAMRRVLEQFAASMTSADHTDDIAVDRFAAAMKAKLAKKRNEGRDGWDDREQCSVESLSAMLVHHVAKGDPVDVANFCMMLHQRGERIADHPPRTYEDGLEDAANVCGSLAEGRLADGDAFEAAMICEAAIRALKEKHND